MKTPTINVNLKPCRPLCPFGWGGRTTHADDCPGAPVLIPCPIPRSVTFEVRLAECACFKANYRGWDHIVHNSDCPARPIRVSCSISGTTWAESEVGDIEPVNCDPMTWTCAQGTAIGNACRERWALVKALVLGKGRLDPAIPPLRGVESSHVARLIDQRDAVFSALADAGLSHVARNKALHKSAKAAGLTYAYGEEVVEDSEPAIVLADYVERLIEQVGIAS